MLFILIFVKIINMYHWLIKICYLHSLYPKHVSKVREYMVEFGNDDRYVIEIIINKKNYTCTLWLNNKSIYKFEFVDPIHFLTNLTGCNNTKVATFVNLLIDQCGFNITLLRNENKTFPIHQRK